MRKKRMMIIGATQCGKTTLANALEGRTGSLHKTQAPIYREKTIECPGAYLENAGMYRHLIAMAQEALCVLMLMDAAGKMDHYSPGFAKAFTKPVIGIVTKMDLARDRQEYCCKRLRQAGVTGPVFCLSVPQEIGISELKEYLLQVD